MTDRELLEMAAKAIHAPENYANKAYMGGWFSWWNPLTDDGDALRLAVKLGIDVEMHGMLANFPFCCASAKNAEIQCEEEAVHIDDMASVRRAIVRAAAAIGSAM